VHTTTTCDILRADVSILSYDDRTRALACGGSYCTTMQLAAELVSTTYLTWISHDNIRAELVPLLLWDKLFESVIVFYEYSASCVLRLLHACPQTMQYVPENLVLNPMQILTFLGQYVPLRIPSLRSIRMIVDLSVRLVGCNKIVTSPLFRLFTVALLAHHVALRPDDWLQKDVINTSEYDVMVGLFSAYTSIPRDASHLLHRTWVLPLLSSIVCTLDGIGGYPTALRSKNLLHLRRLTIQMSIYALEDMSNMRETLDRSDMSSIRNTLGYTMEQALFSCTDMILLSMELLQLLVDVGTSMSQLVHCSDDDMYYRTIVRSMISSARHLATYADTHIVSRGSALDQRSILEKLVRGIRAFSKSEPWLRQAARHERLNTAETFGYVGKVCLRLGILSHDARYTLQQINERLSEHVCEYMDEQANLERVASGIPLEFTNPITDTVMEDPVQLP
jgi:hypothetical protein